VINHFSEVIVSCVVDFFFLHLSAEAKVFVTRNDINCWRVEFHPRIGCISHSSKFADKLPEQRCRCGLRVLTRCSGRIDFDGENGHALILITFESGAASGDCARPRGTCEETKPVRKQEVMRRMGGEQEGY